MNNKFESINTLEAYLNKMKFLYAGTRMEGFELGNALLLVDNDKKTPVAKLTRNGHSIIKLRKREREFVQKLQVGDIVKCSSRKGEEIIKGKVIERSNNGAVLTILTPNGATQIITIITFLIELLPLIRRLIVELKLIWKTTFDRKTKSLVKGRGKTHTL